MDASLPSTEFNKQRWIGFALRHDLVVAFEQFAKSRLAGRGLEQTPFVNIRSKKLANVENVHAVCQWRVFKQERRASHAIRNGHNDGL